MRRRRIAGPVALATAGVLGLSLTVAVSPATASAGTPLPGAPTVPVPRGQRLEHAHRQPAREPAECGLVGQHGRQHDEPPSDFGPSGDPSTPYGIPYTVVSPSQPEVPITFQYADQSDPGPYPFNATTPIEGGQSSSGDRHAIMVNPATCTLY